MAPRSPTTIAAAMAAAALLSPLSSLACSGPGAPAKILANERLGWILWGVSLAVAVALAAVQWTRTRVWWKLFPYPLFAAIHPGWWMSARSGDCGMMLATGSIAVTIATVVGGGLILVLTLRKAAPR